MPDVIMIVLLVAAIGIGYFLGRHSFKKQQIDVAAKALDKSYFKGLNLLLNEQPLLMEICLKSIPTPEILHCSKL